VAGGYPSQLKASTVGNICFHGNTNPDDDNEQMVEFHVHSTTADGKLALAC